MNLFLGVAPAFVTNVTQVQNPSSSTTELAVGFGTATNEHHQKAGAR